jgi:hypothetical protein
LQQQLISIGDLSFTASVLFYNEYFPVQGGAQTFPGIEIPFYSDPTAQIKNNCPVVYVRNMDPSGILGMSLTLPQMGGGTSTPSIILNIAPGGFFLFFNPVNASSNAPVTGPAANPGAVGLGASTSGGATLALLNFTSPLSSNATPMYAEVLLAG